MDRQLSSSASSHTRISLFFRSSTSKCNAETMVGCYSRMVPNFLLENFMEQATELGGKLQKKTSNYMSYSFDSPDSILTVDRLARPYMLMNFQSK